MQLAARGWTWSLRCLSQILVRSHGGSLSLLCYRIEGHSLIAPQRFRHLPAFSAVYYQLLHRVSRIYLLFH